MEEETERVHKTRLLLETLLDYLPPQYRSTTRSLSGPAESRNVPCEVCHGGGKVRSGKRIRVCPSCEGFGWRRRRAGEPKYDEYTGEQVAGEDDRPIRAMTIQEINAALARIERDRAEREGRTPAWDELAWVRKRESMRRHGSYDAVEDAIRLAFKDNPRAVRVAVVTYMLGHDLSWDDEELAYEGLSEIARRVRGEIRVPPWYMPDQEAIKRSNHWGRTQRHEQARGQRNAAMRRAYEQGVSIAKIALQHNMTKRHVRRIVRAT